MYEVEVARTDADKEALRALFRQVAADERWQPGEWFEHEQPGAVYITLTVDGVLAGGMQLVLPFDRTQLPFQVVWPEVELEHPGRTAHITVLAFLPEYRGTCYFMMLSIEVWRMCLKSGIVAVVLEATPAMYKK